ncbi:hypothetical protein PGTUg99_023626 [Puccinia graminis f. sp. tritici]|uniref:Uncharacterized protein n=1 Tax=Puccinia graminis f. sp. tritici TaxID=56615 RepID=A0A5B0MTH9_PUCGR|nr:hypothetical protein PGTUg99_023626 [Puccinia graminis f. sp. tritici]
MAPSAWKKKEPEQGWKVGSGLWNCWWLCWKNFQAVSPGFWPCWENSSSLLVIQNPRVFCGQTSMKVVKLEEELRSGEEEEGVRLAILS